MIVVARIKVKAGAEAQAEQALRALLDFVTHEEPGTLVYVLHRSRKDPSVFLVYEKYVDPQAFDRHGKSKAMQDLFTALQPILDGAPSIELYDELAGKK